MKIGIVTITNGPVNYGNQLQNYAVIRILNKLGYTAETIFNVSNAEYLVSRKHMIKNHLFSSLKIGNYLQARKEILFTEFIKKNIPCSVPVKDNLPNEIVNGYDMFVVGSDQVWNPYFSMSIDHWKYLLLDFAPPEKRIALAPSIGLEEFPPEFTKSFSACVLNYKALSIREDAGARIIKELTGRVADVLIDPTLMLNESEWNSISEKPPHVDFQEKYILTYFLGGRPNDVTIELMKYQNQGYRVYNLLDLEQPNIYVSNPSHFLYLISHADLIMTDSFHACVFSFIYNKPFLVFDREGKVNNVMSRLDTLLSKFDLQRKYINSGLSNDRFEHDYSKGKRVLINEQNKVIKYLKEALED